MAWRVKALLTFWVMWLSTTEWGRHGQRISKMPATEIDDSDDDDDDDDDDVNNEWCCTAAATSTQGASIFTRFFVVRDSAAAAYPQERHVLGTRV